MIKKTYLFCTKLRMFLSEIPLSVLLTLSIIYNNEVDGLLKLWPLIIALSCFMIFIFIYFFRLISISTEEIRAHGLFSSKESRTIEKDKTIVLTVRSKNRLRVELFGKDSKPMFDWIKEEDAEPEFVNLFSEKAVGGIGSVKKVLAYFGVDAKDCDRIFASEPFEKEYSLVKITTDTVNEEKKISIKLLQTV